MKKDSLIILIICIIHSLLFYELKYGLNVLIFTIILLLYLLYEFKINNVKNKKGLLFMVPILILSSTFYIYDNIFKEMNLLVIPGLYFLMYIFTINPTYNLKELIDRFVKVIIEPLGYMGNFYKEQKNSKKKEKNKIQNNKKIKAFLTVFPLIVVVLILLASADIMFDKLLGNVTSFVKELSIFNLIPRIVIILILFSYMGGQLYFLFNNLSKKEEINNSKKINIDSYTLKVLLTSLNVIYVIFDIIQIKGLLLHKLPSGITYASYARRGFLQLVIISIINMLVILITKFSDENKYNKHMSLTMVLLTLVIIASSFYRVYLYESAYGYTMARLLVYIILITQVIMFIPTVIYIFNSKVNIIKWYMIIAICVYTGINLISFDKIIARNNIDRYYKTNKIDIEYLKNNYSDNIPLLVELYDNSDKSLKKELDEYFKYFKNNKIKDFREYNISKAKCIKEIEKINN